MVLKLRSLFLLFIDLVYHVHCRSAPARSDLCSRFPTSGACAGFVAQADSPVKSQLAPSSLNSPVAPQGNRSPFASSANDINAAAFGNPNPSPMANRMGPPDRYPKPPVLSSSRQLPQSQFPTMPKTPPSSPMNGLPPISAKPVGGTPLGGGSPPAAAAAGGGGGMPSGGSPLAGLGGSQPQPQQFGGSNPGGIGIGQSLNTPFFGSNSGTNVNPLSGVSSGNNINAAGANVGQTQSVNFGGLPGLSMLQGLGAGGIPGLGSGIGMGSSTGIGRRKRRQIKFIVKFS